jgi:hypothetical protein
LNENRVLRRIFGPEREEVAEGWRRLHNEELHNLYNSPNVIRVIKWRRRIFMGHVARMRDMRKLSGCLTKYQAIKTHLFITKHHTTKNEPG